MKTNEEIAEKCAEEIRTQNRNKDCPHRTYWDVDSWCWNNTKNEIIAALNEATTGRDKRIAELHGLSNFLNDERNKMESENASLREHLRAVLEFTANIENYKVLRDYFAATALLGN